MIVAKIKRKTEYYCDICNRKISNANTLTLQFRDRFFKVKAYDQNGKRCRINDVGCVCRSCMNDVVRIIRGQIKNK